MSTSLRLLRAGSWVSCHRGSDSTPAPGPTALTAVVGLAADPGVTSVVLSWSAPAAGTVTGYKVYLAGALVVTSASVTAVVTGLTAATAYTGTVRAYGPAGEGPPTTWSSTTLATSAKPTPSNTGPTPGSVVTTITGTYTLLADNVTLTGLHITGDLLIRGNDALIVDCLVDGGVGLVAGSRQVLRRVKAKHLDNPGGFETVTLDACYFGGDGINDTISQLVDSPSRAAHGFTVKNCYFYGRPAYSSGDPHWECIHWVGITAMNITNNVFDYKAAAGSSGSTPGHITAVVTFEKSWTGTNVVPSGVFSGNWIVGGGQYLASYLNLNGGSVVNNNNFDENGTGAGPYTIAIPNPDFTASGNTKTISGVTTPLAITY